MSEVISLRERVAQAELAARVRLQWAKAEEGSAPESAIASKAERPGHHQRPRRSKPEEY